MSFRLTRLASARVATAAGGEAWEVAAAISGAGAVCGTSTYTGSRTGSHPRHARPAGAAAVAAAAVAVAHTLPALTSAPAWVAQKVMCTAAGAMAHTLDVLASGAPLAAPHRARTTWYASGAGHERART